MAGIMTVKTNKIINERSAKFLEHEGPEVGDWVIMPDGKYKRFTHKWNDGIQVTAYSGDTSFYLCKSGYASFSGSLDSAIPFNKLKKLDETKEGRFWVFQDDSAGAHRGVDFMAQCRVFVVIEGELK